MSQSATTQKQIDDDIRQISTPVFFSALRLDSQVVDPSFTNEFAYDLLIKKKSTIHVTQFLSLHLPETKYQQLNRNLIYNALAGCKLWNKYIPTSKQPGVTTYVASVFNTISGGALADILCDVECEKQCLKEDRSKKNDRWSMPENSRSEQIYGASARLLFIREQERFNKTNKQHPRVNKQLLTKSTTTKRDMYQKSALELIDLNPNDDAQIIHQVIHATRKPRRYDAHATMKSFTIDNYNKVFIRFELHTTVTKYAVTDSWALSRLSEMGNRLKARSFTNKVILNQIEGQIDYCLQLEVDEHNLTKTDLLPYCSYKKEAQKIKGTRMTNKSVHIPDVVAQQSFDNFSEKYILKLEQKAQRHNVVRQSSGRPFRCDNSDGLLTEQFYQCMVCLKIQMACAFDIYSCSHGACTDCSPHLTVMECHICCKAFHVVHRGSGMTKDSSNTTMGSRDKAGLQQDVQAQQLMIETQKGQINQQGAMIESVVKEVVDLRATLLKVINDPNINDHTKIEMRAIEKSAAFLSLEIVCDGPSVSKAPFFQQQQATAIRQPTDDEVIRAQAEARNFQARLQEIDMVEVSQQADLNLSNIFHNEKDKDDEDLFGDFEKGQFPGLKQKEAQLHLSVIQQDQNMTVQNLSSAHLVGEQSSDSGTSLGRSGLVSKQMAHLKIGSDSKSSAKIKGINRPLKYDKKQMLLKSIAPSRSIPSSAKKGTGANK